MKKTLLAIIAISIVLLGGYLVMQQNVEVTTVSNFEECIAAGNPAMESYPRQCRHKGVTYVEEVDSPKDTTATSADNAPEGSIHNLPVPDAVATVRTKIANDLGIEEGLVIIMTAYEKTWSDSCLGLGGPAESCLADSFPGYEVTAEAQGQSFTYRTNENGSVLREEK